MRTTKTTNRSKFCPASEPALILTQTEAQFLANHMVRKGLVELRQAR